MSCVVTCARILLIVFTAVLSLVGLLILAAGLLTKYVSETILKSVFEQAFKGILKLRENLEIDSNDNSTTSTPTIDLARVLEPISITLISFGSVLAVLSLIGFFGACCKSKCLLYLYALVIGIIGLALVILSSIILSGAANKRLQKKFLKTIENDYQGLEYSDTASLAWNFVMIQFSCCGLHSYEDFNSSTKWERNVTYYYNITSTLVTPVACCKMNGTFPDVTPFEELCAVEPNDTISNWKTGCWGKVMPNVAFYKPFIALAIAGILIIAVFVILWSCVVANKMNQVYPA